MLGRPTLVAVAVAAVTLSGVAVRFYRRQRSGAHLGGAISGPKMAWLFFTIFFWFLVCPAVALDAHVPSAARVVIGVFAALMWIRGIGELLMLYVWKNWRPPIGVGHDLVCIAWIVSAIAFVPGARALVNLDSPWHSAFVALLVFSLTVEVIYASLFFRAVKGKTVGDSGVWFADDDPHFVFINRLTLTLNVPQYLVLGLLLASAARG